jgi:hypothetical protein
MATQTHYHISRMSNEHHDWMRALDFYKQELGILTKRLSEVSQQYTRTEVKADVEHYQNQFIIQQNNISELQQAFKEHDTHIQHDVANMAQHVSNHTLAEHDNLRDRYFRFEKFIHEMRHDFNRFLSRYM